MSLKEEEHRQAWHSNEKLGTVHSLRHLARESFEYPYAFKTLSLPSLLKTKNEYNTRPREPTKLEYTLNFSRGGRSIISIKERNYFTISLMRPYIDIDDHTREVLIKSNSSAFLLARA